MTEEVSPLKASITPSPSPLNVSIRGPQYLKRFGCLIKDFRHDGGGIPECSYHPKSVTPAIFKPGSKLFKNMDSRLKISGMTNDVDA